MGGDIQNDELCHYGVIGMKWGVRRASRKISSNERLREKALNYEKKSANMYKKSEKAHSAKDLERHNRAAKKAGNYMKKSAKLRKQALSEDNNFKRVVLEKKASKAEYKSTVQQMKANQISRTTGYGSKAMKYAVKSDNFARKAAKAQMKVAKNEAYIESTKRKVNSISEQDSKLGREYLERLNSN